MIDIVLTVEQVSLAVETGRARSAMQRSTGRRDGKVIASGVDADEQGCLAELAVATALGMPWDGKFFQNEEWEQWRTSGHDVGPLEIRSTKHRTGRLILHDDDRDDSPFVLVLADSPRFKLAGWVYGRDGKKESNWEDVGYGRPCYYVKQSRLKPMQELLMLLGGEK